MAFAAGTETSDPTARTTIEHQPALDGVRAVAVLLVLGFHLEYEWLSGGYLGVSLFFTLSGYLITTLLVVGHDRHGRIRFGEFYARRMRRLLPASLATITAIGVLALAGVFEQTDALRRGLIGATFQVENWTQLLAGRSYAELFTDPTPVAHFWSLSIEEQFYWVWPVLMAGVIWRGAAGDRRRTLTALTALWLLTSVSAPLTAIWWSPAAAYFATWTRAAEILAGAVLAVAVTTAPGRPREWWGRLAPVCLVLILLLSALTPAGTGWPYAGGLPLFAVLSAVLIASLQVAGPTRTALGNGALVWIGQRSYGLYLYHWPAFLLLDEARTGLSGWVLDAVRLAVTFALAAVSFRYFEQPIRHGRRGRTAPPIASIVTLGAATAATAVFVVVGVPGAAPAPPPPLVLPAGTTTVPGPAVTATAPPTRPTDPAPTDPEPTPTDATPPTEVPGDADDPDEAGPVVVAVLGDSVPAWLLRDAAADYANPAATLLNGAIEGCDAMVDLPVGRDRRDVELFPPDDCVEWDEWYPQVIGQGADMALLMIGQAPVVDRSIDGRWTHPCETIDWYLADVTRRVDWLRSEGLDVVLALPARPGSRATFIIPDDQDERMGCIRSDLMDLARALELATVDLDPLLCPDDDCDAVRSRDGTHVDAELAADILDAIVTAGLRAVDRTT